MAFETPAAASVLQTRLDATTNVGAADDLQLGFDFFSPDHRKHRIQDGESSVRELRQALAEHGAAQVPDEADLGYFVLHGARKFAIELLLDSVRTIEKAARRPSPLAAAEAALEMEYLEGRGEDGPASAAWAFEQLSGGIIDPEVYQQRFVAMVVKDAGAMLKRLEMAKGSQTEDCGPGVYEPVEGSTGGSVANPSNRLVAQHTRAVTAGVLTADMQVDHYSADESMRERRGG